MVSLGLFKVIRPRCIFPEYNVQSQLLSVKTLVSGLLHLVAKSHWEVWMCANIRITLSLTFLCINKMHICIRV